MGREKNKQDKNEDIFYMIEDLVMFKINFGRPYSTCTACWVLNMCLVTINLAGSSLGTFGSHCVPRVGMKCSNRQICSITPGSNLKLILLVVHYAVTSLCGV